MNEKNPESISDIVDRAVGELRSSVVPPELPPELLESLLRMAKENEGAEQGTVEASTQTKLVHPTLLTRYLNTWRWMMRSPVSRVAAAVIFVFAVMGVALLFHGSGATYAFADFIEPILNAKTVKFKIATQQDDVPKGMPATTVHGEVMVLDATRMRQEMEVEITMPDQSKTDKPTKNVMISIIDWNLGKGLALSSATKQATIITLNNLSKEQIASQDILATFRSILLDARDKPNVKREPLGEKVIDGRSVVGFRVISQGSETILWGDPKTGLPVRAEMTMALFNDTHCIMSDFEFDVPMDESLFSVEPPPGYTVQNMSVNTAPPEEKDLIEMFRTYGKICDAVLPDSLDTQTMWLEPMQTFGKTLGKRIAMQTLWEQYSPMKTKPTEEQMSRIMAAESDEAKMHQIMEDEMLKEVKPELREKARADMKKAMAESHKDYMRKFTDTLTPEMTQLQLGLQRGLQFYVTLGPKSDAYYAGKGVKLGTPNQPIFWYRPKDSKKYRIIYADLTVLDADPPKSPDDPPVPIAAEPKK